MAIFQERACHLAKGHAKTVKRNKHS